jgi:hypothetical protein
VVARGAHVRLATEHGAVHVWIPAGYRPESAGIALYVHGYYTDVDKAWSEHRLGEQFAASGRNALFIVPEAPAGLRQGVYWRSLGELIRTVRSRLKVARPAGPVVAIGHSGAYRTLLEWLEYPPLDEIVMLDALYGEEEQFAAWMERSPRHRLIQVGADTLRWTEELAVGMPDAVVLDRIPDEVEQLELGETVKEARLVYLRSQLGHMPIVTDGVAIPLTLRMTRLGRVAAP